MRTPLSSGLAAASLGLLLLGLAARTWQIVLLALPPIIVLAFGSIAPPARPRLAVVRSLSRERTDSGHDVDVELLVRNEGASLDLVEIADVLPRELVVVRRINWKASARLEDLFTNEYEGERSGDVVLVVDARRESFVGTEADNPVEHAVRAALAIADRVLAAKNRVGLIVQREVIDWVPLAFGRKQLYRILDHLVHVKPGGDWRFSHAGLVLSRFFPRDCLIVLITPLQDRDALGAVVGLAALGYDVAILSPSSLEIERRLRADAGVDRMAYQILAMERANLVTQLRRVAQVVDWDPATPLALALRRVGTWPRPA